MRGHPLYATAEREGERETGASMRMRVDGTKGGKMPGVRPITQADGANQGAMRLP